MPFVAPTFAQTAPGPNGFGTVGDPSPSTSDPTPVNPTDIHPSNDDNSILKSLNRPDWIVVSKSDPDSSGSQRWVIAGPNGQNDTMIVGTGGKVIEPPAKTPEKPTAADVPPSPPDKWVPIVGPDGTPIAMQDPAHASSRVDIPRPPSTPAPRTDTPAAIQNANTAATNAAINAANSKETAARDQANQDRQARLDARAAEVQDAANKLAAAKLQYDKDQAAADLKLKQAQLDASTDSAAQQRALDQYKVDLQNAHDKATEAQASYDGATTRLRDENTAQYQQGTLSNQAAQNAETASNNQANQQLNAATLLQKQQAQDQAAQDAAATRSETLLKDRATLAQNTNSTLFNAAASAKNYGLGSSADVSGLPAASEGWATQMMGGQPLFDQAVKMVHDANPALSNTPQGAAYTSLLEQVLQKKAQLNAGGLTTQGATAPDPNANGTTTTSALAPPGVSGTVSPSDPRYLGAVIGHATSSALSNLQLSADSQFTTHPTPTTTSLNNTQLSPDSQFTAPGAPL